MENSKEESTNERVIVKDREDEQKITREESRRRGRVLLFGVLPVIVLFLTFCYLFISSLEK